MHKLSLANRVADTEIGGGAHTATDDERHLYLRRANDSPPAYRVKYDGVEVGSVSETSNHVSRLTYWRWGVDTCR
jgi:hypothetical protein